MKVSQTAKILALLKRDGHATNRQLNRICYRYAARIHELRREGHKIVSNRVKEGLWDFVYFGEEE